MNSRYIESANRTIDIEQEAIAQLKLRMDASFDDACNTIINNNGRVVVTGMGKSGHIGNKIAATLASTGTASFFVHPAEASHGDLGMIEPEDVVLAISNSGNSHELLTIIPVLKRKGITLIAMTGNDNSPLAQQADVHLNIGVDKEACPLGLAPTASTTATLVMGDALSVALLEAKGFSQDDFAISHPGGSLGRKLLLKVEDVMHTGQRIPKVDAQTSVADSLVEISEKGLGLTGIVDESNTLLGLFTDGDLRRALDERKDLLSTPIEDLMTRGCKTISKELLAVEALNMMESNKITGVLVVDENRTLIGVVHMHDLLRAGVI